MWPRRHGHDPGQATSTYICMQTRTYTPRVCFFTFGPEFRPRCKMMVVIWRWTRCRIKPVVRLSRYFDFLWRYHASLPWDALLIHPRYYSVPIFRNIKISIPMKTNFDPDGCSVREKSSAEFRDLFIPGITQLRYLRIVTRVIDGRLGTGLYQVTWQS
jgi:hypothetical protein